MMKAAFQTAGTGTVGLWATLFVWGIVGLSSTTGTAQETAATSNAPVLQTISLEQTDVDYSFANWSLNVQRRSDPFENEPEIKSDEAIRGLFRLGGDAANSVAFLWDQREGNLYLDLNRNLDLTDDAKGVFSCEGERRDNHQAFPGIRLPMETKVGDCEILVDLDLYSYRSRLIGTAGMRSFWQAKMELQGRDWQLGVIDNRTRGFRSFEESQLLLRPWEAREKAFNVYGGALDAFPASPQLYFDGQSYGINGELTQSDGRPAYEVRLTEWQPDVGALEIPGEHIHRLILKGGGRTVVLDKPSGTQQVPVGTYRECLVQLQKQNGDTMGSAQSRHPRLGIVTVKDSEPATLVIGGPLTNSVTVNRRGRVLVLNYRLLGVGGKTYQLVDQDRSKPPRFTIFHGDKEIASGNFEFG